MYSTWTRGRDIASLGTNDGATPLAFQKWHNFKEAFAPELIYQAVNSVGGDVNACLDPFGGSGTTALTCQMLGIESTTVEVNPYLADVIRAKLHTYNSDLLVARLRDVRRVSRRIVPDLDLARAVLPPTFIEPGVGGRWIFGTEVASALVALLEAIDLAAADDEHSRRFFRVVVGGMLTEVSNVLVSGKGRRYRRNWQERSVTANEVLSLFALRVESAIADIITFAGRPNVHSKVVHGDARTQTFTNLFDLSVFSPPYPNSFDYTDVYNVQLWMLGYLTDTTSNITLRRNTLASHVQVSRTYKPAPDGSTILSATLHGLDAEKDSLWSKHLPAMVGGYFQDLLEVTETVLRSLRAGGECWMVVGDSRYGQTHVPVADVIKELLSARGYDVYSAEPIRHMKTSAQQGFKSSLAESLLKVRL
ncbi:site-specific DNA-methyltransferase [Nocardioides jishulii]|uniref:Site-specific DNA-methyltransferase n=1 Tax=Nocardioides jishulii TaxID=2575440 RepID=A0A4U2YRN5_9ACTN|nr:site-specific DNA-methyltransferase [Nocardioides jishulii]QCX26114.1 site-specific DNA-methyltransferase [Nocardioides jishulii]TKI64087.1 site-specific DNA-methyltransferase [Nocardioides jishulii]